MTKRIVLADPRGFCAGVDRAILTVQTILKAANTSRNDGLPPVYVRCSYRNWMRFPMPRLPREFRLSFLRTACLLR